MQESTKKLLLNTDKLEKLENELLKLNPFEILKIGEMEIRHSNVLAWLLDPKANHQTGDWFLRNFIKLILDKNSKREVSDTFDIEKAHLIDLKSAIVYREKYNIDILVETPDLILIIENKINARERKGQLSKYSEKIDDENKQNKTVLPVFLTKESEDPEEVEDQENYYSLGHREVYDLINRLIDVKEASLSPGAFNFVEHYKEVLENILGIDKSERFSLARNFYNENREIIERIKELQKKDPEGDPLINIYNKNATGFDFIINNIANTSPFHKAMSVFSSSLENISIEKHSNTQFHFLPEELKTSLEEFKDDFTQRMPFKLYFKLKEKNLELIIYAKSTAQMIDREELFLNLHKADSDFRDPATINLDSKYGNRIYSSGTKVNPLNESEILEASNRLYEDSQNKVETLIKLLTEKQ